MHMLHEIYYIYIFKNMKEFYFWHVRHVGKMELEVADVPPNHDDSSENSSLTKGGSARMPYESNGEFINKPSYSENNEISVVPNQEKRNWCIRWLCGIEEEKEEEEEEEETKPVVPTEYSPVEFEIEKNSHIGTYLLFRLLLNSRDFEYFISSYLGYLLLP